jgi:hypothetical protein
MYSQKSTQILPLSLNIVPTLIDYLERDLVILLPMDTVYLYL